MSLCHVMLCYVMNIDSTMTPYWYLGLATDVVVVVVVVVVAHTVQSPPSSSRSIP